MKKNIIVQIGICLSVARCGTPLDKCRLRKTVECGVTNNEKTKGVSLAARYQGLIVPRGGKEKDCKDHLPYPAKIESDIEAVKCYLHLKVPQQEKYERGGEGFAEKSLGEDGSIIYNCDASPSPRGDDPVATVKWQKLADTAVAKLDGVELEMTCSSRENADDID